ncbi:hypothetical protein LQK89_02715 [Curtobacterium sp. C1]|uniref:hypothetical protein n=1 Tax=Curtobacterium sp. C1 TaxID=2898151 RepID=UPI001E50859D|nr:hypothetical protein [Curtobacterium sp. C1]UFU14631.1 hypothetical protein LQK89_02715 [Curtobacterium sp. C1]
MSDLDDDTEITEMHTPRVDLVSKAANGTRFFLAKSATSDDASIFSADDVLALAKAQEGDMTDTTDEPLAKDAGDKIDPTVDTSKVDAAGDPNDPTSAAWEAVDAANAQTAIELAVALKRNITAAIEREATEVAVGGDPDDADNVWTLQGASDAVDCIVAALAPFAVSEAAEAEDRETDDASVVLKSGRVLSGVNEGRIRQAQSLLEDVVGSLPAPVEDVAKTDAEEPVVKADDEELTLVYTADGKVLGAVKASNITTFAATPAAADDAATDKDAAATDAAATDTAAAATTGEQTADQTADATDDSKVIPGTETVQSPAQTDDDTPVTKGLDLEVLDALKELTGALAKQADEKSDLAKTVAQLEERLEKIAQSPDDRRSPVLNGATGVAGVAARDGAEDQHAELRKAIAESKDPAQTRELQSQLAFAEIRSRFA